MPRIGRLLQATGTVQSAARYKTLPLTLGRCGCVEGKRCSVICGESSSLGSGLIRMVGRRGDSFRRAVTVVVSIFLFLFFFQIACYRCRINILFPSLSTRSSGGLRSPSDPPPSIPGPCRAPVPEYRVVVEFVREKNTSSRIASCGRASGFLVACVNERRRHRGRS